jgi:predicted metal-dependent HD superfamily phosphohydrolase
MTSSLNQRWSRVWSQLGITYIPNNVFAELTRAYSSPGRYYHNLTHIKDCLRVFDEAKELAERPAEVELAIWFHDAIYDTRASGNEQQSADWAHRVITELGLGSAIAERVDKLILATCHTEVATEVDAQLLVDVDLSILGSEPDKFWEYERNIRKEYDWVPPAIYNQKRGEILSRFLHRPHIYQIELYRQLYEAQARENLGQAIDRLKEIVIS